MLEQMSGIYVDVTLLLQDQIKDKNKTMSKYLMRETYSKKWHQLIASILRSDIGFIKTYTNKR